MIFGKNNHFSRISISSGVTNHDLLQAKKAAKAHRNGKLSKLPFTESNYEWVLLYEHAQKGQITPEAMRDMKRIDLYYLAGMTFPHPELLQPKTEDEQKFKFLTSTEEKWDRITKLQGNAARANIELKRRNFLWSSFLTIFAALIGGYIGAVLGGA